MEESPKNTPKQAFEVSNLIFVKGGTFDMGDVFGDNHRDNEKPVHSVRVADFYMAACCVTFEEYIFYCFATGKDYPDDEGWGQGKLPIINVSWYDAVEYCNFLSLMHGLEPVYSIDKTRKDPNNNSYYDEIKWIVTPNWQANGYRLPTEAEWEYAAREGGKKVRFGNGQNTLRATEANFIASADYKQPYSEVGEYRGKTVPVDSFKPNALGLYNMSGNVWEWCWDWFDEDYYQSSPQTNPRGSETGSYRVLRGGGWFSNPLYCRVAYRINFIPPYRGFNSGFRLVCVPQL